MKKIFTTLLLLLYFISPAYAQLADTPSSTLKGNLKRDGRSPYVTNIQKPYLKWKIDAGNGIESAPAIGEDGTLYFSTAWGNFIAIDREGNHKWTFSKKDERFSSSPTLDKNGTIYFIATVGKQKEYNPTFDGYDYFGVPTLYALNPDGTEKWKFVLGGLASGVMYSPAIGEDGTIYSISGGAKKAGITDNQDILRGDRFWAINPDGTEKWSFKTGDAMYSAPVISDDGTIYFGCADEYVYALNPDGSLRWKFSPGEFSGQGAFSAVPSIGPDGTIYIGSKDKYLYALNPDGTEKWRFKTLSGVEATPSFGLDGTIYNGVYSPSDDPYLYAINPETGKEIWRFETGQGVYGSPVVDADGILFFGSYDGYLYSLNPDGTQRWKYKTNGGVTMPPVIDIDGTVYFGSWDNNLYAITGKEQNEESIKLPLETQGCDPSCTDRNRCTVCNPESYSVKPTYEKKGVYGRIYDVIEELIRGLCSLFL